jgi:hypothetical protein
VVASEFEVKVLVAVIEIMEYVVRYVMEGRVTPQKEYREKKRSKGRKRVEDMRKDSGNTTIPYH